MTRRQRPPISRQSSRRHEPVIQGIIAGIGFLGDGVILRGATGKEVYTPGAAHSLWVTTASACLW